MDAPFSAQLIRRDDRPPLGSDSGAAWLLIIAALILLGVAVTIFGAPSGTEPVASGSSSPASVESIQARIYTVSYKNGVFSPTNLRIHGGDTVRFRNDGIVSIRIVSDLPAQGSGASGFDSVGEIPPGSFFAVTFAVKGTYTYHNARDTGETGAIIVR